MKASDFRGSLRVDVGPEPVDNDAITYLECLQGAAQHGFAPVGWLYTSVMDGLCEKGFAYKRLDTYYLAPLGMEELAKRDRNKAREAG